MNVYKAPNLIISPKRKVYRRGGGEAGTLSNESVYTHTYTHTLSLSPPYPLSLSPSPSPLPIHTYIYHSVRKRRLLGREKMCLWSRFEG